MRKHGHRAGRRSPTYNSWRAMIERCTNPKHAYYPDYGGRGIVVCARWRGEDGFANFLADLGERPPKMTLDRRDVHGDYVPENCRWSDAKTQRWNRRDMREPRLEFADEPTPALASTPASAMPF